MNKKALLILPLFGMSLASCADTSELYYGNQYATGDFMVNRYSVYAPGMKEAPIEKTIELVNDATSNARFFCGSGKYDSISDVSGFGQAKVWHSEDFGSLVWEPDITPEAARSPGNWFDQSSLVGKAYGATKKLSLVNEKFSKGYLSKLYNGQVRCNSWSSYSWVEIDQEGYGAMFPLELSKAKYFAMSLRGGSDFGPWRLSDFDVNVTFYKQHSDKSLYGTRFVMNHVVLQTNRSSNLTSLVGFYFDEVGERFDPNGIVGMSVSFSMNDEYYDLNSSYAAEAASTTVSTDFTDKAPYHIALIIYEVFFPDSTWY